MSLNPKWAPMRWRCGPIAAAQPSTSGTPGGRASDASQRTAEQWTDPALLHLLDGTPINCLVVDWATGGEADSAQQKALLPLIEAGRRKGISFVGRVTAMEGLAAIASAGHAAGLEALLSPGPVTTTLALASIAFFSRDNLQWDQVTDIFVLNGNVWPGATMPGSRQPGTQDTAPAGPTQDPWVDSNGWISPLAQCVVPGKTLWLELEPPASAKMLPLERYCLTLADARASGCRWIIDLDEPMRAALAGQKPEAIAAWNQIAAMDAFFDKHSEWAEYHSVGVLTVVSDFRGQNAGMSNEVLHLLQKQRVPFTVADRTRPLGPRIAGKLAVLWVDDTEPSAEQHRLLMDFVEQGGLVVAPKYWGPKGVASRQYDWLFDYDIYSVGKGRIVVASGGFTDPFQLDQDTHLLVGHEHDVCRLFNPGTASCVLGSELKAHKEVVQVLNYNAPQPVDYLTLWINHAASAATLWSTTNSSPLKCFPQSNGTSFDLPPVAVYYAVEIERQS
jgi:hypothetical protein